MSRELLKRARAAMFQAWANPPRHIAELYLEIGEYLAQPEPEPIIEVKLVGGFNAFVSAVGLETYEEGTKLYTYPPDQSSRIVNLEIELGRICDIHTEAMGKYHDLEQQLAALQAKREPLSDDEMASLIKQSYDQIQVEDIDWGWGTKLALNERKLIRLVEKYHGIGVEE